MRHANRAGLTTRSMQSLARSAHRFFNWFFRSRVTDKITVVQLPNAPLWVFIVATIARLILRPSGLALTVMTVVGTAALMVWAVMEVGWGVNPFRRTLGAAVLIAEVAMQVLSLVR